MRGLSPGLFITTVLVSAFLLFQVQPMLARYVLPWFGGTPAVWTVCMLFFQVFLFLGYAYAHALQRWFKMPWQALIHVGLVIVAVFFLPIEPSTDWRAAESTTPIFSILMLLATTVGVPYFLLSSTGPLLQVWFARAHEGRSPYPLYAVSNLGSFVALLTYPLVFEPLLPVSNQVDLWSWGFGAFAVLCSIIAFHLAVTYRGESQVREAVSEEVSEVSGTTRVLWIAMPASATLFLLSVTNHITQDIAAIPLLWVIPLSLYLLTFILCFESDRWYRPKTYAAQLVALIIGLAGVEFMLEQSMPFLNIFIYNALLFVGCMMCHGELAALRPGADKLTSFYLSLAGGGALGGIFVGMVAPMIFRSYLEMKLSFLVMLALVLFANRHDPKSIINQSKRLKPVLASVAIFIFAVQFGAQYLSSDGSRFETTRNFYGVLKQNDYVDDMGREVRRLVHGRIVHGLQYLSEDLRDKPTSYYGPTTGVGRVMGTEVQVGTRNIGVVGLGAGTLSAYGKAGDAIRYYEINPAITEIARSSFDFLSRSKADVSVVHGDALITLEEEEPQSYDILVLDAFSGDAIPVHLLTVEAFETYMTHVKDGGAISIHISNNFFDLKSVVWGLADRFGLQSALIESPEVVEDGTTAAQWIVLSTDEALIARLRQDPHFSARDEARKTNLWTNDFSNVLKVLKIWSR